VELLELLELDEEEERERNLKTNECYSEVMMDAWNRIENQFHAIAF